MGGKYIHAMINTQAKYEV